jgi:hypothetical protein
MNPRSSIYNSLFFYPTWEIGYIFNSAPVWHDAYQYAILAQPLVSTPKSSLRSGNCPEG